MGREVVFNIKEIEKNDNGKKYIVTIKIPTSIGWIENMHLVLEESNKVINFPLKHKNNENGYVCFENEIFLETKALYRYYFKFLVNNQTKYVKKDLVIDHNNFNKDNLLKMSVNFETPKWAQGKVMYHIFVDRFNKSDNSKLKEMKRRRIYQSFDDEMIIGPDKDGIWNNDFYGGDLQGIIDKLDYIKSLGVSMIYLSPIVHSQSNHRYDTSDYENVDPYVGCNEDLKRLCDESHKKGMYIILDAVFNHTGNDSKYFNEYNTFNTIGAFQSSASSYASFYKKHYENGQMKFDYWWGMPNLPVCDGNSLDWQEYILGKNGIIDQWFKLGIDGLRLDVADELTDDFIEKIRIAVKRNKEDGLILGEVWKNPMRMNRSYIESGKGMDSVMNYSLIDALIRYFKYADTYKLNYIIKDIQNEYPKDTINTLMNFTSTHDITRALNIFLPNHFQEYGEWAWNLLNNDLNWCQNFKLTSEEYKKAKDIYQAYIFTLSFLPGILSIFYGDEVGLDGMGNLMNRKPYPWKKQDLELLKFFIEMGKIRKNDSFLEQADLNILDINKNYLMFERINEEEKALIAINRTSNDSSIIVPKEYEKEPTYSLGKSKTKILNPYGGIYIKK